MDNREYQQLLARLRAAQERQAHGNELTRAMLERSVWRLSVAAALLGQATPGPTDSADKVEGGDQKVAKLAFVSDPATLDDAMRAATLTAGRLGRPVSVTTGGDDEIARATPEDT